MEKCWNNVPDYIRNNFADEDTTYILYYIGIMYMKLTKYAMSYVYFQKLLSRKNLKPIYRSSAIDCLKFMEYKQNEQYDKYNIKN